MYITFLYTYLFSEDARQILKLWCEINVPGLLSLSFTGIVCASEYFFQNIALHVSLLFDQKREW